VIHYEWELFLIMICNCVYLSVVCNVLTDFTIMKIIPGLLLLFIISCAVSKNKSDKQTLDFGSFVIETPKGWIKINAHGADSYVGRIAIDNTDTLDFDLGWYSNKLDEHDPTILDSSMIGAIDTSKAYSKEIIFVKDVRKVDPDKYKKNNVSWDTIDGRKAKIVFPRQSGIGTTGIYIDSLWPSGSNIDKFNLYGDNLKTSNEKLFLQALRTLKFHKTK
jgi:hypothetical protein